MTHRLQQPQPTCRNCWVTYLSAKPHEPLLFCPHFQTLAYLISEDEWEVVEHADRSEVQALRRSLARQSQ